MKFAEKLAQLTDGKNKQRIGRDAGLPPTAISDYIAKNHIPRADTALKLARALKVPLEWLVDEAQEGPPPSASNSSPESILPNIPFGPLIRELARRYRLDALDVRQKLHDARKVDWSKVFADVQALPADAPISRELTRHLKLAEEVTIGVLTTTTRYDIRLAADFLHDQLPGAELPIEQLTALHAEHELRDLEQREGFASLVHWMNEHRDAMRKLNISPPVFIEQIRELAGERTRIETLGGAPPATTADPEQTRARVLRGTAEAMQMAANIRAMASRVKLDDAPKVIRFLSQMTGQKAATVQRRLKSNKRRKR